MEKYKSIRVKGRAVYCFVLISFIALVILTAITRTSQVSAEPSADVNVPSNPLPEAADYATVNFKDAWDMSDFSDISQNLNNGGRSVSLTNIQVQDSVFSGLTLRDTVNTGIGNFFHPLFGGYANWIHVNKNIGRVHPIVSSQYNCLYIAMKVNSPAYPGGGSLPDNLIIGWETDQTVPGSPSGGTTHWFYPESISGTPVVHNWKLYKIDLSNPPYGNPPGSTRWQDFPEWRGIRLHTSTYPNIVFAIDWIRLTSCTNSAQFQAPITWTPDSGVTAVWARPEGTTRNIQLVTGINGSSGSYTLDTKGLVPGRYQIGMGTLTTCCSKWSTDFLTINQMPVSTFIRPSPSSGQDYAALGGNPWDIRPDDVIDIQCTTGTFSDHILSLDTLYPAAAGARCRGGGGETDSRTVLNLPTNPLNAADYRYLNFSHYINGEYALPADGMIGRWIWRTSNNCTYVSNDIAYDVGWRQYAIDLFNPAYGTPIASTPSSCGLKTWQQSGQITSLRFDPNENWTGNVVPAMIFHQEIDWIKLSKVDQVAVGTPFPVSITLNKSVSSITSATFYFTTDLNNPTQHPAQAYQSSAPPPQSDQIRAFLPILTRNYSGYGLTFNWNTTGVSPGTYYICVRLQDSYNQATYCSDAPVQVYTP